MSVPLAHSREICWWGGEATEGQSVTAEKPRGHDTQSESRGAQIVRLMKELASSPERRVLDDLDLLQTSIYVFRRNHEELIEFLDICETDPQHRDSWDMTAIRKTRVFGREAVRVLHNFLASAMSLRDLTNRMHKRLHSDGSFPEYTQEARRRFSDDPLVRFVQKLRSYLLHVNTPNIVFKTRLDVESGRFNTKLGLSRDELQGWDGWTSVGRRYLEESDKHVELRSVVNQYEARIRDFYEWFGDVEQTHQDAAFSTYKRKEERLFRLEIEDRLHTYFTFPDSEYGVGDRGLFLGLFDISEFERLGRLPAPSSERTELALALLKDHLSVSADLEARIRRAYSEERFFRGVQPSAQ